MSLEQIRKKNKKNDGVLNETIGYSMLSDKEVDFIKMSIFRRFIEKIGNDTLENLS